MTENTAAQNADNAADRAADTANKITRVGVIGAGQMGAGIAEVCARAQVDVLVWEKTREATAAGRARILKSLDRGVSSGKITEREREQAVLREAISDEFDASTLLQVDEHLSFRRPGIGPVPQISALPASAPLSGSCRSVAVYFSQSSPEVSVRTNSVSPSATVWRSALPS